MTAGLLRWSGFLDGNGRMGRLPIAFCLCKRRTLTKPVLYLSHYFQRHRLLYYDLLQAVRDEGAWEPWLKFFLTGIAEVASEASETARKIVQLREEHRSKRIEDLGKGATDLSCWSLFIRGRYSRLALLPNT